MRKEVEAVEWLFLIAGVALLLYKSEYQIIFIRLFQGYYFLLTIGLIIWLFIRYYQYRKKQNVVIFYLKKQDEFIRYLIIKSFLLLIIVGFTSLFINEFWIPVLGLLGYFAVVLFTNGILAQPKIIFQHPSLYKDGIFKEDLSVTSFQLYQNGVKIEGEQNLKILYEELDISKFNRDVDFEENQLLDDVLLTGNENEVIRVFINEITQYAEKLQIPISRDETKLIDA